MTENNNVLGGVINQNSISSDLLNDLFSDSINVDFENYLKDGGDPELYECDGSDLRVYGFILDDKTGLYDVDPNATLACIIRESVVQVVKSDTIIMCASCSPCYPLQNDLNTPGPNATYGLKEDDLYNPY